MHRLLKRQVKKYMSRNLEVEERHQKFIDAINDAYNDYESDLQMLDRSLKLSSAELVEANRGLRSQKQELEANLKQIRQMKDQLVLQEKMASLGSLTAGIAHEIKNPLNFVNNFADLSKDLLIELKEILEEEPIDMEDLAEVMELLSSNLNKIVHHGNRADKIVKGMLLHSRGKSGERELTDINSLLEEYVNLAYHGLRAQNTQFNCTINREYQEDLPKANIVPQNLSRVFLNIISNAFYAANKRKKQEGDVFSPTIDVKTRLFDANTIEVQIEDNGIGIPKESLDKIFNPFFTTKPPGEGTGLGLSITYDIVVQEHNGTLDVKSTVGEGTLFAIRFPIEFTEK